MVPAVLFGYFCKPMPKPITTFVATVTPKEACLFRSITFATAKELLSQVNRSGAIVEHDDGWLQVIVEGVAAGGMGDLMRRRSKHNLLHVVQFDDCNWYFDLYQNGKCVTRFCQSTGRDGIVRDTADWKPGVFAKALAIDADQMIAIHSLLSGNNDRSVASRSGSRLAEVLAALRLQPFFGIQSAGALDQHTAGRVEYVTTETDEASHAATVAFATSAIAVDALRFPKALFGADDRVRPLAAGIIRRAWANPEWFLELSEDESSVIQLEGKEILLEPCAFSFPVSSSAWRPYLLTPPLIAQFRRERKKGNEASQRIAALLKGGTKQLWFALALLFDGDLKLWLSSFFTQQDFAHLLDSLIHWVPEIQQLVPQLRYQQYYLGMSRTPAWAITFLELANLAGAKLNLEMTEIEFRGDWLAHLLQHKVVEMNDGRLRVRR